MKPLLYLSVCSGIEAATVAWHGLGWTPVAFAEIEAFPSAALSHHYPAVPNLGDMTRYLDWPTHFFPKPLKTLIPEPLSHHENRTSHHPRHRNRSPLP